MSILLEYDAYFQLILTFFPVIAHFCPNDSLHFSNGDSTPGDPTPALNTLLLLLVDPPPIQHCPSYLTSRSPFILAIQALGRLMIISDGRAQQRQGDSLGELGGGLSNTSPGIGRAPARAAAALYRSPLRALSPPLLPITSVSSTVAVTSTPTSVASSVEHFPLYTIVIDVTGFCWTVRSSLLTLTLGLLSGSIPKKDAGFALLRGLFSLSLRFRLWRCTSRNRYGTFDVTRIEGHDLYLFLDVQSTSTSDKVGKVGDNGDSNDNGEGSEDEDLWEGGERDEENDEEIEQESEKFLAAFLEMIALIAADNDQGKSALVGVRAAEIDKIDDGIGNAFPSAKGGTAGKGNDQARAASVTTTGNTPYKVIIPGLPTLPGYQCTRPEAEVASASTAAELMTIKANLLQGASVKMDINDQGTPSQMGRSSITTTKSQKCHLRRSKTKHPLSFESDRTDMFNAQSKQTKVNYSDNEPRVPSEHKKAQLRDPMFNNFLQAIDVPSVANFEGQPPSAILAASNYHTIEYLDQLLKARLHANRAEQSRHIAKRAFTALAAKHADDIRTPATNEERIFMARYREVHCLNTKNQATAESATAASSSAGPSGTSEAHATHPAPTPTEVPVQTSTVMVGTIPITVTAPSIVPEGPEEDMQSTFSA
ncbi:hypothetical protein BT96DRAFT_949614 [Gymnopus androsaceus JB14]|uniref:Uncharacterized protein n=1 Tax=Gymnopus androsaceus JB14 TaxID=1447944 RepID=A0A6A4GK86_9AGAR|nr:hypothetical protein BT96DRAFT_949614 [Gymnopus androsaceus JB14]